MNQNTDSEATSLLFLVFLIYVKEWLNGPLNPEVFFLKQKFSNEASRDSIKGDFEKQDFDDKFSSKI